MRARLVQFLLVMVKALSSFCLSSVVSAFSSIFYLNDITHSTYVAGELES